MKVLSKKAAGHAALMRGRFHSRINAAEGLVTDPVHQGSGAWKHEQIVQLNADLLTQGTYREALTTYAVGYPGTNYVNDLQFLAPGVQVRRRFSYKTWDNDEAFYSALDEDLRAPGADFKSVEYTSEDVLGQTQNRGLMICVDRDEITETQDWEQHYTGLLVRRIVLNRVRRAVALLQAAGTDNAATWDGTPGKDPDMDMLADIETGANASGVRANRVAFGPSAWTKRKVSHRAQNSAGGFASAGMNVQEVAEFLGLEAGLVCNARYTSGTGAKTAVLGSSVILFNGADGPTREDPSNIKRFWTPCDNNQEMMVHRWDIGPKKMCIAVEINEVLKITSTLGIRKKTIS